jgi:peptidoglycan/LPS O-acetylase OafA/YrhL
LAWVGTSLPKKLCHEQADQFLIWSGGSGVSLFFVLSGFLITYLLLKEYDKNGRIDVGAFYVRRTLRIWPLYFALVLFGLFVYAPLEGFYQQLNSEKWKYLFFAGNFACLQPGGNIHPISITWSVAVEEQFYLVVAPAVCIYSPQMVALYLSACYVALPWFPHYAL